MHRAQAKVHFIRNLGPRPTLGAQLADPGDINFFARAPYPFALRPAYSKAGAHALH
jgi:hypothetical protein